MKYICSICLFLLVFVGAFSQSSLEENHIIKSFVLQEDRLINITLPEGYGSGSITYPVLYLLDGEYIYKNAIGTVDILTGPFGHLPKMIVVGIPNTVRNRDLFVTLNPSDGYVQFIRFLELEVLPLVDRNYQTNGFNILYGWSSGSGLCMYMLANKTSLFEGFIQSGIGIGQRTSKMLTETLPSNTYTNKYLYANCEGTGPRIPGFKTYETLVKELNPNGLRYRFEILEGLSHVDVLSQGLQSGLKFIFSSFFVPDSIAASGAENTISYYNDINNKYNIEFEIPEGAVNESAAVLFAEGKPEEALKLLLYGAKAHPNSADLLGSVGAFYEAQGNADLAARYYEMARNKSEISEANYLKYAALSQKVLLNIKSY